MADVPLLTPTAHDARDHTGVPGVGGEDGGGGEFTEQSTVKLTSGDLGTSSTTFVDATGLTVTLTTAAVRCLVLLNATIKNSSTQQTCVDIAIDGTRVGGDFGMVFSGGTNNSPATISFLTDVLTAGSHTIKAQWRVDGGTGTLYAATTTAPATLQVIETSMAA